MRYFQIRFITSRRITGMAEEVTFEVGLRIGIESGFGRAFISIEIVSLNSHEIDQTAYRSAAELNEKKNL